MYPTVTDRRNNIRGEQRFAFWDHLRGRRGQGAPGRINRARTKLGRRGLKRFDKKLPVH